MFYYDFFYPDQSFTDQDLKTIQKEMYKSIRKDYPIRREAVSREEAARRIKEINEPYKLEILDMIKTEPITIYHIGDEWWDLCAGPHVESTKKIHPKAIDLESVAGQVASGCTVIHFVTGNGSVTNFPFAPTLKVVTTSARYALLAGARELRGVEEETSLDGRR